AVTLKAQLYSDNVMLLDGTAVITQITDTMAKIQLLGGNSEMNFYQNGDKQYIDELDMSDWFNIDNPGFQLSGSSYIIAYDMWEKLKNGELNYEAWKNKLWSTNNPWVAFPVLNESNSIQCNDFILRQINNKYQVEFRMSHQGEPNKANGDPQIKFAIQPYIYYIVEKIVKALGYSLPGNMNALQMNSFFKRIFIASANNRIELNKSLPHWTVNEFITQIENFFGVVFKIEEISKTVSIISKSEYFDRNITFVNEVVDEYTRDVEKDNEAELSTANIGYGDNCDKYDKLSDDVNNVATFVKTYKTIEDLQKFVQAGGLTTQAKKNIYECNGRHFIVKTNDISNLFLEEVNCFRNRIQNDAKKDVDIELKIIPCKMIRSEISAVITTKGSKGEDIDTVIGSAECTCLSRPDRSDFGWSKTDTTAGEIDLDSVINGETTTKDEVQTVMYVAINNGKMKSVSINNIAMSYPAPYIKDDVAIYPIGIIESIYPDNLGLNTIAGKINMASEAIDKQHRIDTKIKYCFQFISASIPDPADIFIIQNKKYVCDKLEIQINSTGIDRLITGYFYPF
ncbi:MAG: hypothetical protein RSA66_09280, partial [Muribaculaceae bacterium]